MCKCIYNYTNPSVKITLTTLSTSFLLKLIKGKCHKDQPIEHLTISSLLHKVHSRYIF